MPAIDSPAVIVARFLRSNGYEQSYDAFVAESGLPIDAGDCRAGALTLETLMEEKKAFDYSLGFERLDLNVAAIHTWSEPAPSVATPVQLPSTANIISLEGAQLAESHVLLITSADRSLHILDIAQRSLRASFASIQDSPILCSLVLPNAHLLTASMSGQVVLSSEHGQVIETRKDHSKYVTRLLIEPDEVNPLVVTSSWDGRICIYRPEFSTGPSLEQFHLGAPSAVITLPSKPEAVVLIRHPEDNQPILVVGRSNSTKLYYYTVEDEPRLLGHQDLSPHSTAWVAFTPSALALCPTDPSLLAVATSTIPHMRLIIVRMIVPPYDTSSALGAQAGAPAEIRDDSTSHSHGFDSSLTPQAAQARAELVIADREQAAIQLHCNTMAPQTPYSTPVVVWRPDGSGVWVNGDDGAVRGIEARSGKVVATLKGHAPASKVRCLWAGRMSSAASHTAEEVLFSGGFDQKLIMWSVMTAT